MRDAEKAKQEAMDRVEDHANEAWKQAAALAVGKVALRQDYLTTDDVMEVIDPGVRTHEPRAWGPVMKNAAKEEWIEKSNFQPSKSKNRVCHARPKTVWKSLLFKEI